MNKVAEERGQTLAQMALSWVLRDGDVTSVLIGASKPEQIRENVKIVEKTEFSEGIVMIKNRRGRFPERNALFLDRIKTAADNSVLSGRKL